MVGDGKIRIVVVKLVRIKKTHYLCKAFGRKLPMHGA